MKLQSRVEYTLTNRNGDVFDAALNSGFEAVPDGEKIYFCLTDDSGNYAECEGRISGSTFTREELYETDNPDGVSLPVFDATVTARSAFPAFMTQRSFGESALVAIGDETLVGFTNGGFDSEKDLIDPEVLQTRYNWRNSSDVLTTVDDVVVAGYPLYHSKQYSVANSLSPLNGIAMAMKRQLGFNSIRILPATEGGVSFSSFEQGGANYTRLQTMLTSFLSKAGNTIGVFVVSVGRLEAKASESQASFAAGLDTFRTNIVADVLANTGVDISRVPFVYLGLPDNFRSNFPASSGVQAALADTPSRQSHSSFLSLAGMSTTGTEDLDAGGSRAVGDVFANAYRNAFKPVAADVTGTITGASTTALGGTVGDGSSVIQAIGGAATTATGGTVTPSVAVPVVGTITGASTTATGGAVSGLDNSLSANNVLLVKGDTGITKDGSNLISVWADQSGNGNDLTQPDSTRAPVHNAAGGYVDYIGLGGLGRGLEIPPAVMNDSRGWTLSVDMYGDDTQGFNVIGGQSDHLSNLINVTAGTTFNSYFYNTNELNIPHDILGGARSTVTFSVDKATGQFQVWVGTTRIVDTIKTLTLSDYTNLVLGSARSSSAPISYFSNAPIQVYSMTVISRPIDNSEISAVLALATA